MRLTLQKIGNSMHCLAIDRSEVEHLLKDGNRRVLCQLNNQLTLHSALLPRKEGGFIIAVSKRVCKELGITAGSVLNVELSPDTSVYQFEMPEEMEEVLQTDERAKAVFDRLTPGNQRSILSIVNSVKSPDKRVELSLRIAEKLKRGITSIRAILKRDLSD